MEDKTKIVVGYMFVLLIVLLFGIKANAQVYVNDNTFKLTQTGISVVEFYADWNKDNKCNWIADIAGAKSYRVDLNSETARNYNIDVLPTLILFNDGTEVYRFEGNLSFKLCPKKAPKKVQKVVNKIIKSNGSCCNTNKKK